MINSNPTPHNTIPPKAEKVPPKASDIDTWREVRIFVIKALILIFVAVIGYFLTFVVFQRTTEDSGYYAEPVVQENSDNSTR